MKDLANISEVLDELIRFGEQIRQTRRTTERDRVGYVDGEQYTQWLTRCRAFAIRVFGGDSEYYKALNEKDLSSSYYPRFQSTFAHLRAIESDIKAGAIFRVEQLVEAEVFDELLEQAEYLAQSGYRPPAAVIAGCVLEETLRRMCVGNAIALPSAPKLDWMNSELAKAGIYQKLMQKKVTALADIRNSAAHGKWSEFSDSDVDTMIRDVRDFVTRYYS